MKAVKINWNLTRKLIFFSLILVVLGVFVYRTKVFASVDDLVVVGDEEYVLGPRNDIPDSAFFTAQLGSSLRGYDGGGGSTFSFVGTNLANLNQEGVALAQGTNGNFDECGAWLVSSYKLKDPHWIGWYHGEEDCDYNAGITHKSLAFVESFDGGKTWTKPNYPNNRVITADSVNNGNVGLDDAGDGKVIKIGNYFYFFYLTDGPWGFNIARSLVSDQGKPGTWYKYYNGNYNQPGLGGHSSTLSNMDNSFVVLNSYLNRYMTGAATGKWGMGLDFSQATNFLFWEKFPDGYEPIYPEVTYMDDPNVDNWSLRDSNSKSLYAYTSFVNADGNSDTVGREFYMYYMKLFPGDGFDKRYLMRRKVEIKSRDDAFHSKALLTRYAKVSPKRTKVSTEIAKPAEGYSKVSNVGYLASNSASGFHALYECYDTVNNGYVTYIGDPSLSNWQTCGSSTDKLVRKIGYAADSATSTATLALNYCFDAVNSDHFLSTDPACEGKTLEFVAGYIFPLIASTPTPTPTVTPTPTPTVTPTPTPTPTPGDTIAPQVQITSPSNNGTVVKSTSVAFNATATDNVGVSRVEFYVNSSLKCTDTTAPYQCTWKVPAGAGIVYTLQAKAYDAANNQASNTITVTSQ